MAAKLLILLLACGVFADESSFEIPTRQYKVTSLGKPVDLASVKLLKEAVQDAKGQSVVSSPLGVLMVLSLYSAGTTGELRNDIIKILGGTNYTEITKSYRELSHRFNSLGENYLNLANKVYLATGRSLKPTFLETAKGYDIEVEQVDFADAKNAAKAINDWAEKETSGHIKDAVSENDITSDLQAGLFNVIYFKGHWGVIFNPNKTEERDFYVKKDKTVKRMMMKLKESLFYRKSSKLGASMVELPYKEKGFRMIVVLPDEIDGLPSVLEKVAQNGLLEEVNQLQLSHTEIDLILPKFDITSDLKLNDLLTKMGLSRLFTDSAPDLLVGSSVRVSKAIQKAFIKLDEEGSTAGALTGLFVVDSLILGSEDINFHADHPFLFAILYEDTILFIGTYQQ